MNKKVKKRLDKVALELPIFPVMVKRSRVLTPKEFVEEIKAKHKDKEGPIPDSEFIIGGQDMRKPKFQDPKRVGAVTLTYDIEEPVNHIDGLKKAYMKGGVEGVEQYCKEVTRYHLALQRKMREANKQGVQNQA